MQPGESKKRGAGPEGESSADSTHQKRIKTKKNWQTPKPRFNKDNSGNTPISAKSIEPGDSGIWVTCDMHKEARCVSELRSIFDEHAKQLYDLKSEEKPSASKDVEDDLAQELQELRGKRSSHFRSVKLDTQCLLFFKTTPPVEPVSFVTSFCEAAAKPTQRRRGRSVRRLTPISLIGKATSDQGIEDVAKIVLAPHFHAEGQESRKFAIRINMRNHTRLKRDDVISLVANVVGSRHKVDLKQYDLLILVEIFQNICGLSVVGREFERLKRFNLSEIHEEKYQAAKVDQ